MNEGEKKGNIEAGLLADEHAVQQLKEYDGKKLVNITKVEKSK